MSLSSGLIRGCSGAALGFKTEENENVLRIYGFEGEPGGEGEVETRIYESKRRRRARMLLAALALAACWLHPSS